MRSPIGPILMNLSSSYLQIYEALKERFGYQHWWPARTPFEVCVGAVLTQNTNWANVEKAISNLGKADCLSPARIAAVPESRLRELIRPAGYFRQKSQRLKRMACWVVEICGDDARLDALAQRDPGSLRASLLELRGIGPETADSILLYALNRPVFVVDAYTARILGRHGLISPESGYDEIQAELEAALPHDPALFGDFHAQLVRLGKECCRKTAPRCGECPLEPLLGAGEVDPS